MTGMDRGHLFLSPPLEKDGGVLFAYGRYFAREPSFAFDPLDRRRHPDKFSPFSRCRYFCFFAGSV